MPAVAAPAVSAPGRGQLRPGPRADPRRSQRRPRGAGTHMARRRAERVRRLHPPGRQRLSCARCGGEGGGHRRRAGERDRHYGRGGGGGQVAHQGLRVLPQGLRQRPPAPVRQLRLGVAHLLPGAAAHGDPPDAVVLPHMPAAARAPCPKRSHPEPLRELQQPDGGGLGAGACAPSHRVQPADNSATRAASVHPVQPVRRERAAA
mmetsp:Transcript_4685/g.11719  ORF Transcript_4685/g.11719 Transcript_4685/m.11719 type:complete len:205 (+) Transcript_4685:2019-2633(+)